MMKQWYLSHGETKSGPYSLDQLKELAQGSRLFPTDLLMEQGTEHWVAAFTVPGLFVNSGNTVQTGFQPKPLNTTLPAPSSGREAPETATVDVKQSPPALWNPNAAALWSALFSPIFGAYLQGRNWRVLGHPEKAEGTKFWVNLTAFAAVILPATDVWAARLHLMHI